MYCEGVDNLYVKANGEVPCACSPGEHFPLFRITTRNQRSINMVRQVLNGPEIRQIRRCIHRGKLPFDYCCDCPQVRPGRGEGGGRCYEPNRGYLKRVDCLQLEPSFLCNVDCPFCVARELRKKTKRPPYLMPMRLVKKVVSDLSGAGMPVRLCALSGRGEPLMNPRLPEIVQTVKNGLGCAVSLHTNGNFPFVPALLEAGVDSISVAVDGVSQRVYERYRRGGDLAKALQFMKASAAYRDRTGCGLRVIWQYILFNWNMAAAQLEKLFRKANNLGVDELLLVETDTPGGELFSTSRDVRRKTMKVIRELRSRHRNFSARIMSYRTAYRERPPIEVTLRLRHGGRGASRQRPLLEGRIVNLGLEPLPVRIEARLTGRRGCGEPLLLREWMALAPREEQTGGLRLEPAHLKSGFRRIRVNLHHGRKGKLLLSRELVL